MANTNGSQIPFLTPARAASGEGIRIFDLGESLPLSAHQKEQLSAVLARIVEQYPAHQESSSPGNPVTGEESALEDLEDRLAVTDDTSH